MLKITKAYSNVKVTKTRLYFPWFFEIILLLNEFKFSVYFKHGTCQFKMQMSDLELLDCKQQIKTLPYA